MNIHIFRLYMYFLLINTEHKKKFKKENGNKIKRNILDLPYCIQTVICTIWHNQMILIKRETTKLITLTSFTII